MDYDLDPTLENHIGYVYYKLVPGALVFEHRFMVSLVAPKVSCCQFLIFKFEKQKSKLTLGKES